MKKGSVFFVVLILLISLCTSCPVIDGYTLVFDRETFERERRLWLEQGIEDYAFHLGFSKEEQHWSGTLVIQDGAKRYISNDTKPYGRSAVYAPPDSAPVHAKPIADMYTRIAELANVTPAAGILEIEVEYDREYHYPLRYTVSFKGRHYYFPHDSGGGDYWFETAYISGFDPAPELLQEWPPVTFDRETFERERRLWLEQGIQDYAFHLIYSGNGYSAGNITIQGGTFDRFADFTGQVLPVPDSPAHAWIDAISGIFAAIETEADEKAGGGIRIFVQYDYHYHYPTTIDYLFSNPNAGSETDVSYQVIIGGLNPTRL
jgi:hypothetical protein